MSRIRKIAAILVAVWSATAAGRRRRGPHAAAAPRAGAIRSISLARFIGIVKRTGDGFIQFRSVVDAVRCAIEVQNGLVEPTPACRPRAASISHRLYLGDVVESATAI